ncbi:MAG TPA: carboxypeptidase-like regulatory domain-containing protein [Polyangiaceae bacterium]|nr:carboxypeptidase-like regulatory domain-containing protein [Polyangiaceae bacterium]
MLALARGASAEGVGEGTRARSALGRVGVPSEGKAGNVAAAVDLSGGYTEALSSDDSAHARVAASAAAAVDAARFLNVGVWLGGRYDHHADGDDGTLFQSELSARLAWRFGGLGVGVEGAAWLPGGNDIGSSFSALSADGKLLLSGHTPSLVVAGFAGYRLDRSSKAAGEAPRLSFGDRSALGASDYDAVLAGLGLGYVAGKTTLFGEAAAQLLLGSPQFGASPIFVTLGARRQLGGGLSAELALTGLVSARPDDLSPTAPLFPIEPRATLALGVRYRFGENQPAAPPPPPPPPAPPDKPVVAPPPPPASVELSLLDDRGQPLKRAQVVVTQEGVETPLVETEPGHYRLDDAKPGKAHLRANAEGFKPIEQDIDVGAGKPLHVDAHAEQALPAGQVRGLVRSFRGKPLAASIHLEPGAVQAKTDAEGFFQIDVPPGEYEVVIEAPGYEPQRRKAKVDQQGVVIVNADLVQKK